MSNLRGSFCSFIRGLIIHLLPCTVAKKAHQTGLLSMAGFSRVAYTLSTNSTCLYSCHKCVYAI